MTHIPKLRFPEFTSPTAVKNLGDVVSIFNGYAFKSIDSALNGVRWLKIADVGIQIIEHNTPSFLPSLFSKKYSKFSLNEGDVVVALTRPILGDKLKIALIDKKSHGALLNQRVGKLRTNENLLYVYYLMQSNKVITSIINNIAGTDPPNLSPSEIKDISVQIGCCAEQQKIADFLTAVDRKISQLTEKHRLLNEYKKGAMQQLFSQRQRFKDKDGNTFPEWETYALKNVLALQSDSLNMLDETTYELITVKRGFGGVVSRGFFKGRDVLVKNQFTIHENEFVISKRQIVHGACGLVPKALEGAIVSNEYNVFRPVESRLDIDYFNRFVITPFMRKAFFINSDGVHIEKLLFKTQSWLKTKVNLPCLAEQQKIAQFLQAIDNKIAAVAEQIEQTKLFKKGLLQQIFV
ncbi:restriction endonuclease subunit S [Shewanella baltica]|uniref:restriction endonuclease subunit S n=1 Tax=Shewanella baltica TaxID=62322 RepID=UPI003D005805